MATKRPLVKSRKAIDPPTRSELLASVFYTVSQILQEEECHLNVIATESFVSTLAELVFAQLEALGQDLDAFARHAGRAGIITEDMQLVCRKNPALLAKMDELATRLTSKKT